MPLTSKGREIFENMAKEYGEKKGESVFYASRNKGTICGVDAQSVGGPKLDRIVTEIDSHRKLSAQMDEIKSFRAAHP